MASIPEEDHATEMNVRDNSDAVTTTLGLQWNSAEYAFVIQSNLDYPDFFSGPVFFVNINRL